MDAAPTHPYDDHAIRHAVEAELSWTPEVNADSIGVAVANGAVTLTGEIDQLRQRAAAVKATQRVRGVVAVADELEIRNRTGEPSDTAIAQAVTNTLQWLAELSESTIKAEVHDHTVTLTGTVEWNYLRVAAKKAVQALTGVHHVDSRIELSHRPEAANMAEEIRSAMQRNAILNDRNIQVTVDGDEVTITGDVHSWTAKRQAGLTAWASPNVRMVHNHLRVVPAQE